MASEKHLISRRRLVAAGVAFAGVFVLSITATLSAQAQTFTVIHNFSGAGNSPFAGLTIDRAGNLYGTTAYGGNYNDCGGGCGTVFKLTYKHSGWILTTLYNFQGSNYNDGNLPASALTFGPGGKLYGTTTQGGGVCVNAGCGIIFSLQPTATVCPTTSCAWSETVLRRFDGADGGQPLYSPLNFDGSGNIFGTTPGAGYPCYSGTVFELTPSPTGWTEHVLHCFLNEYQSTYGGVVLDQFGNLYGTSSGGGSYNNGTVFELMHSSSGWVEKVLYSFQGASDGATPMSGLIFDGSGNLYGTTEWGGPERCGTAFELSPSNGNWTFNLLYAFGGSGGCGGGPIGNLVMDASGNLYGTTFGDGAYGYGSVFKLTPGDSGWTYTPLHDFTDGLDGGMPSGAVTFDQSGNLYGTAGYGGENEGGVAFEISSLRDSQQCLAP